MEKAENTHTYTYTQTHHTDARIHTRSMVLPGISGEGAREQGRHGYGAV